MGFFSIITVSWVTIEQDAAKNEIFSISKVVYAMISAAPAGIGTCRCRPYYRLRHPAN